MSYKITAINRNLITLDFNGVSMSYRLPLIDGLLPEGTELTTLLDSWYQDYNTQLVFQESVILNLATIQQLVEAPTPLSTEELGFNIRGVRTLFLKKTDWTQYIDSPIPESVKAEWLTYRTELRDISIQQGFPTSIIWPVPPSPIIGNGVALSDDLGNPIGTTLARLNRRK